MYLVDTNVLSEARRGSQQALSWLRSVDPARVYLSTLTLGEIRRGIVLKQKSDPAAAAKLAAWLHQLRLDYAGRTLAVTDEISVEWGRIAAIRTRGEVDGLIAATAIVHNFVLITRNRKDFEDTGASVLNPWDLLH